LSIAVEGARLCASLSVDVPRPSSVDVRKFMPYMGVRQPRLMMTVDADAAEPSAGSARPIRVGNEGRQGVGRPMSVDVVRQPHSSLMGVYIAKPMPIPRQPSVVDVVLPPPMGADVGPMPAHVSRQSGTADVGVASGIPRPTLADVRPGSQKLRPDSTASRQSSPDFSLHEWLQTSRTAAPPPSPAESVSSSSSELQQVFASGAEAAMMVPPSLVYHVCHVHLGVV